MSWLLTPGQWWCQSRIDLKRKRTNRFLVSLAVSDFFKVNISTIAIWKIPVHPMKPCNCMPKGLFYLLSPSTYMWLVRSFQKIVFCFSQVTLSHLLLQGKARQMCSLHSCPGVTGTRRQVQAAWSRWQAGARVPPLPDGMLPSLPSFSPCLSPALWGVRSALRCNGEQPHLCHANTSTSPQVPLLPSNTACKEVETICLMSRPRQT